MSRVFEPNPGFRLLSALTRLPSPRSDAVEIDGQTLDPGLQRMLAAMSGNRFMNPPAPSLQQRRTMMERSGRVTLPRAKGVDRQDRRIEGPGGDVPIRVYRAAGMAGTPPAIMFLHGGGFMVGSIDSHDALARTLARTTRCVVVSVGYRLAPEHPHPAAVQDCLAVYDWLVANAAQVGARPGRIAVAGDSAGGTLAAVLSLVVRDRGTGASPIAQLLLYPVTDLTMSHPSYDLFATGFLLTRDEMEVYRSAYAPQQAQWTDPSVSPLFAQRFDALPPTSVWTAGFDPLRDEGQAYSDALRAAGVDATCVPAPSMIHGYLILGHIPGGLQRTAAMCREAGALVWRHAGL